MDTAIWIAIIAVVGPLAGALGSAWATRSKASIEREQASDDRMAHLYENALARQERDYEARLARCEQQCSMWRDLALKNLGGMEVAAEMIEQTKTTGGTS